MSTAAALGISAALVALSAFFVAIEFALVAARRYRLEEAAATSAAARAALRSAQGPVAAARRLAAGHHAVHGRPRRGRQARRRGAAPPAVHRPGRDRGPTSSRSCSRCSSSRSCTSSSARWRRSRGRSRTPSARPRCWPCRCAAFMVAHPAAARRAERHGELVPAPRSASSRSTSSPSGRTPGRPARAGRPLRQRRGARPRSAATRSSPRSSSTRAPLREVVRPRSEMAGVPPTTRRRGHPRRCRGRAGTCGWSSATPGQRPVGVVHVRDALRRPGAAPRRPTSCARSPRSTADPPMHDALQRHAGRRNHLALVESDGEAAGPGDAAGPARPPAARARVVRRTALR